MRQESASQSQWLDHAIGPDRIGLAPNVFMFRLKQTDAFNAALLAKNPVEVLKILKDILLTFEAECLTQKPKPDWALLDGMIAEYLLNFVQKAFERKVWSNEIDNFLSELARPDTYTAYLIEKDFKLNTQIAIKESLQP